MRAPVQNAEQISISSARSGDISYLEMGSGDAPALVMLHGIGSNAGSFAPLMTRLAARRRVIAWNAPGYGASAPLAADWPSADDYARALCVARPARARPRRRARPLARRAGRGQLRGDPSAARRPVVPDLAGARLRHAARPAAGESRRQPPRGHDRRGCCRIRRRACPAAPASPRDQARDRRRRHARDGRGQAAGLRAGLAHVVVRRSRCAGPAHCRAHARRGRRRRPGDAARQLPAPVRRARRRRAGCGPFIRARSRSGHAVCQEAPDTIARLVDEGSC